MDDEEEIVRELRKLESMSDDLYLNDADASWGGSKRVGVSKYEKRGSRGAPPDRSQGRFDPENSNNFDNWDLERQGSDSGKFDPRRGGVRGRSKPFERTNDRRDLGANGAQKPGGRGKPYENSRREDFETMSNTFDIEGKLQRGTPTDRNLDRSWSRESREGPLYGRQLAMDDPDLLKKSDDQSGYVMHRKDPRLTNKLIELEVEPPKRGDPRLSQKSDGASMDMYRAPTKDPRVRDDPRLTSQDKNKEDGEMALRGNALGHPHPKSDSRAASKPEQPRGFQNRFMPVRSDPRQQQPLIDFNKPRAETIFEKISNNPALLANQIPGIASEEQRLTKESSDRSKRGPRSPSGSVSPGHGGKKDRNGSPGRKRERSPARNRGNRWERSPSPRGRRDRSVSPRRRSVRKERSVSTDRRRSHDRRDWSSSPRRDRQRRERSPSPRRRRRSRSGSGDRSTSAHRTTSPPARGQRGGQPRYPPGPGGQAGYDMPPPGIYGDNYQPPPYGAPPAGMPEPWPIIPGFPYVNNQLPPKQWLINGPPQYPPYQQQQYHYENYGYPPQPSYGEYPPPPPQVGPPPPHGMPPGWGGDRAMMYPDMSQPPPPSQPPVLPPPPSQVPPPMPVPVQAPAPPKVDVKAEEAKKEAKEAAIKNEVLQQKQTLSKQREEYMRKSSMISRELKLLKDQEQTLREENCRDNDRILRENNKLQLEIQNKLKAINNVIDMLTGIIGDKKELEEKQRLKVEAKLKHPKTPPETPPKSSSDSSPETNKARLPEPPVPGVMDEPLPAPPASVAAAVEDKKPVFNYVHYDPEMHWCRVCDVFPRTAKEFLNHLHSAEHRDETQARKMVDMPWHKSVKAEEEAVYYKGAPTKRTPIRGLQFFISATAWYCKLCDTWIGDLHCASLHLKSKTHTENYVSFTEQSPHWETDWLADREKAYEHKAEERRQQTVVEPNTVEASPSSLHDDKSKRNKKKKDRKGKDDKDGKKKKRRKKKKKAKDSSGSESSSSSSSEESSDEESEGEDDKGKSIRVAMRNKMKAFEDELKEMPTGGYMRPSSGWQSVEVKEEERLARELQEKQLLEMERREKYLKAKAEEQFEREQAERERYEMQLIQEQQSKFRKVPAKEDKMLSEWMGPNKELPEGERQILTGIRDRVKMRQEAEKDIRKRDDRDRYYDNRYHEEGNRRRRRGESPEGRSGKRGRSRSPEERRYEKVRGGEREVDRSQGRYKRSPQRSKVEGSRFQEVRSDSMEKVDRKHASKRMGTSEQDEAESKFERQAAEAAARLKKKDKKPVVAAIPKSKLPFIGRMPIMKHLAKKKPGEEEPPPETKEKLPEVGLVLIGPTLPPHLKPPGLVIPEELGAGAGAVVQDMDIDDEDSNAGDAPVVEEQVAVPTYAEPAPEEPAPAAYVAEPAVESPTVPDVEQQEEIVEEETVAKEATPKKPLNDIPLPKDFQEALNILFPGQTKPGETAAKDATPPAEVQPAENQWSEQMSQPPPHAMGYGPMMGMPPGMPPGMHPMFPGMLPGINGPPNFQVPPPNMMNPEMMSQPPPFVAPKKEEPARKKAHKVDSDDSSDDDDEDNDRFKSELSADDLAMLGIDAGDMAAQSF